MKVQYCCVEAIIASIFSVSLIFSQSSSLTLVGLTSILSASSVKFDDHIEDEDVVVVVVVVDEEEDDDGEPDEPGSGTRLCVSFSAFSFSSLSFSSNSFFCCSVFPSFFSSISLFFLLDRLS